MSLEELYITGEYLKKNPTWHVEESPWKAKQIMKILARNSLNPKTICEVGCGAGEVLKQLQQRLDPMCTFMGYDISPQAFELSQSRANDRLHFKLSDINAEDAFFDLILVLDVVEHVEDYFNFLRSLKAKSQYKIIHLPLDVSVQSILRSNGLLNARQAYGHIHYFTKNTAMAMLKDVGYEVIDYFYAPRSIGLANTLLKKVLIPPRVLFFSLRKDLAVRVLGGYSLLVLVK